MAAWNSRYQTSQTISGQLRTKYPAPGNQVQGPGARPVGLTAGHQPFQLDQGGQLPLPQVVVADVGEDPDPGRGHQVEPGLVELGPGLVEGHRLAPRRGAGPAGPDQPQCGA